MNKYIDADKLIAEIERQNVDKKVIEPLIRIITSLQQEQPEADLEKEIATYFHDWIDDVEENVNPNGIEISKGRYAHLSDIEQAARHFYELGLNARKGE